MTKKAGNKSRPQAQVKAWQSGVTLIDVWALLLIHWLNPSIYMQRRCPMQIGPIRQDKMVLSGSYGNKSTPTDPGENWENAACRQGSDAAMLQIRRLHARSVFPFGPAPTLKLFCHSFYFLCSGQSVLIQSKTQSSWQKEEAHFSPQEVFLFDRYGKMTPKCNVLDLFF